MLQPRQHPIRAGVLALVCLTGGLGCRGSNDGPSEYDQMKQAQESSAASLADLGAKVERRQYPQGEAWAVSLPGVDITNSVLDQVRALGRVSELDLSRSTVTDAHLERIGQIEFGGYLLKIDLSNTAVTDAGLEKLDNLALLSSLNLAGSRVTPAGVAGFKQRRQANPRVMEAFRAPTIRLN